MKIKTIKIKSARYAVEYFDNDHLSLYKLNDGMWYWYDMFLTVHGPYLTKEEAYRDEEIYWKKSADCG